MIPFSPKNDLVLVAKLQRVSHTTGGKEALTEGDVTAFVATSSDPDAEPAHEFLTVSPAHAGGGRWIIAFDASVLTVELLDGLFGEASPYLIVELPDGFRVYAELEYVRSKAAT